MKYGFIEWGLVLNYGGRSMDERITSGKSQQSDFSYEESLRPRTIGDYVGQDKIKGNLEIAITAPNRGVSLLTTFFSMAHPV